MRNAGECVHVTKIRINQLCPTPSTSHPHPTPILHIAPTWRPHHKRIRPPGYTENRPWCFGSKQRRSGSIAKPARRGGNVDGSCFVRTVRFRARTDAATVQETRSLKISSSKHQPSYHILNLTPILHIAPTSQAHQASNLEERGGLSSCGWMRQREDGTLGPGAVQDWRNVSGENTWNFESLRTQRSGAPKIARRRRPQRRTPTAGARVVLGNRIIGLDVLIDFPGRFFDNYFHLIVLSREGLASTHQDPSSCHGPLLGASRVIIILIYSVQDWRLIGGQSKHIWQVVESQGCSLLCLSKEVKRV